MLLNLCGGNRLLQQRIVPRFTPPDGDAAGVVEPHGGVIVPRLPIRDHRDELVVRLLASANRRVKPSLDAELHEFLGIGQCDVVGGDRNVRLVRFFDNHPVQRRRQPLPRAVPVVHPDLDELGLHLDVIARGLSSLLDRCDRIRHVGSGRVALSTGIRPGDARAGRLEERCTRDDFVPHPQRHVAPLVPAAAEVRTLDQIGNADDGADPVVRETLQMVDEVLARVVLLGHRPVGDMLEPDVAVEVDFCRHDCLAGQIHSGGSGWHLKLAPATNPRELSILDDERGALDGRAAVAGNEPRAFEQRRRALRFHRGRARRDDRQDRYDEQTLQSDHSQPPAIWNEESGICNA